MDVMTHNFTAHLSMVGAMAFGVAVHIAKKAGKARMLDQSFDLSDYLLGHPYQSFAAFGMTVGAYFQLLDSLEGTMSLFAAFTAGVAANSFADFVPGDR